MLEFALMTKEQSELLLPLCKDNIGGTEGYSSLISGEDNFFWAGRDEEGHIKSLAFDNSDEFIKVFGDSFPPFLTFNEKCLMVYEDKGKVFSSKKCEIKSITGKELLQVLRLLGEGEMTFDDKRRYVTRLRYVNRGLSAVFGIYSDGVPVCCAFVGAVNEKYALISNVFTKKEFRGRGYAALCVAKCISYSLERGLIPYLRCEENMRSYYEKSGFVYYGKM